MTLEELRQWRAHFEDDEIPEEPMRKILDLAEAMLMREEERAEIERLREAGEALLPHLPDDDPTRYKHSCHLRAAMDFRAALRQEEASDDE